MSTIPGPCSYCGSPDHWRADCVELADRNALENSTKLNNHRDTDFKCGCTVQIVFDRGHYRHGFTSKCDRHHGHVRTMETENERMALVREAYRKAKEWEF